MTFILNGLARILIVVTRERSGRRGMSEPRIMWRKSVNNVMLTLTGVAAFGVVDAVFDFGLFDFQRRHVR